MKPQASHLCLRLAWKKHRGNTSKTWWFVWHLFKGSSRVLVNHFLMFGRFWMDFFREFPEVFWMEDGKERSLYDFLQQKPGPPMFFLWTQQDQLVGIFSHGHESLCFFVHDSPRHVSLMWCWQGLRPLASWRPGFHGWQRAQLSPPFSGREGDCERWTFSPPPKKKIGPVGWYGIWETTMVSWNMAKQLFFSNAIRVSEEKKRIEEILHQLRLIVYPTIYSYFFTRWCRISERSTVVTSWDRQKEIYFTRMFFFGCGWGIRPLSYPPGLGCKNWCINPARLADGLGWLCPEAELFPTCWEIFVFQFYSEVSKTFIKRAMVRFFFWGMIHPEIQNDPMDISPKQWILSKGEPPPNFCATLAASSSGAPPSFKGRPIFLSKFFHFFGQFFSSFIGGHSKQASQASKQSKQAKQVS